MLFYCRADVGDDGQTFKQQWIIVGHVSYTVLAGWYCCASEAGQSTEGQSVLLSSRVTRDVTQQSSCTVYMADIVLEIGIDASFIRYVPNSTNLKLLL